MSSPGTSLVAALLIVAGGSGADEHLLAGARLFRGGQYAEALVEFRVAEKLGSPEARAYAGAALVKLERPEEAAEAFGGLEGAGTDALLDYYRALAAYECRLYQAADRLLAAVGERSGPKIGEQVARLRAQASKAFAAEPSTSSIDWYLARCSEHRSRGRAVLAAAYCREAAGLSGRRSDRYRLTEARPTGGPTPGTERQ